MLNKTCFKCGKIKTIDEFYKHSEMEDGHLGKCKECTKKDVTENYFKNREYYAEYSRKHAMRPEARAAATVSQRKRRARNSDQYKANQTVANAIRDGRLKRKPCEVCECKKVEAHHEDYSEPFIVEWLCRKHHLSKHGKIAYEFNN